MFDHFIFWNYFYANVMEIGHFFWGSWNILEPANPANWRVIEAIGSRSNPDKVRKSDLKLP